MLVRVRMGRELGRVGQVVYGGGERRLLRGWVAFEGRRRDGIGREGVACLLLGFLVFGGGTSSGLTDHAINSKMNKTGLSL